MQPFLGVVGAGLLVYALIDLLWTCFLEGGAPVTTRACSWLARALLKCQTRRTSRRLIAKAGLVSAITTVLVWGVSIWTGWTLIFCASPGALVASDTGRPADVVERVYFVGRPTFTLGLADYKPVGSFSEMVTAPSAGWGFSLSVLAPASLVPVFSAA